ncbi:MAG: aerobic carbon-monoxide dehydrogenase medium subunit [Gaiellaceae bacterium]|jgi:carbon-monoxide dehydrogenase medium subunit|nr:aerobic carbon-monoxide dehydrogenase medium subunit [Gaiellaceae bacterium]
MIPAPFDYEVAESVEHAISLLGSRDDTKVLAGGHSLLPLLRLRLARPSLLVDVGRLDDLSYVREAGDSIAIGALTRHHDVVNAPLLQEHNPLVAYAAGLIGDPQVRHRGTIGGSLAHGDPASDLPAVALALDCEIDIAGPGGVRTVPASEFFLGVFQTAVGPDELVTEVRVPKQSGDHVWSYLKFRRRAQDWATVGVAAVAKRSNGGVQGAAISLVSMGATPLRAAAAESAWNAGEDPGAVAAEGTDPPSDTNGSADYRRHLVQVLVRRAVEEAGRR